MNSASRTLIWIVLALLLGVSAYNLYSLKTLSSRVTTLIETGGVSQRGSDSIPTVSAPASGELVGASESEFAAVNTVEEDAATLLSKEEIEARNQKEADSLRAFQSEYELSREQIDDLVTGLDQQ